MKTLSTPAQYYFSVAVFYFLHFENHKKSLFSKKPITFA